MEPSRQSSPLTLPVLVFGLVEVRRLSRELESLDAYFMQSKLVSSQPQALPKVSRLLDSLARENHFNLQQAPERQIMAKFLQEVAQKAPSVHMSFAADPSSAFTAKIVAWLRANIHPYTLLQLGLQPSIAAGCELRTPSHIFDFSLRNRFDKQRGILQQSIAGRGGSSA